MTVVWESEVTILDPHITTATISRTFGLHVFDMLFAMNDKEKLIAVVTQLLPYIGYPRALSALSCVNEVIPEAGR